jgi:predicted MPP superfamily phosphohydrolase
LTKTEIEINGPYLMCPKTDGMTVACETDRKMDADFFYGSGDSLDRKAKFSIRRETDDSPDGTSAHYIYTAGLKNLSPDTEYRYEMAFGPGHEVRGKFRTLSDRPHPVKVFLISDSHLFRIDRQICEAALSSHPDFVVNMGDIPAGTGFQREQYIDGWFRKVPRLLESLPVVYIPGNHDDGPYYNDFFASSQALSYCCDATGRTFSFDYGQAHFLFADSNSWGLTEMNAVNSGIPVDEHTREIIHETLNWMIEDLKSEKSKKALWRILILHHPYTDSFTNQYVVPIAEKYNVNLLIGGHLHYYIKNALVDQGADSKVVCITQGSAQDPAAELDTGSPDKRLLTDFPEAVATGNGNYGILNITEEKIVYQFFGLDKKTLEPLPVDTVVVTKGRPQIDLSDLKADVLDSFGNIEISGMAKNRGEGAAALKIRLKDNGAENTISLFGTQEKEKRMILLNGRETKPFCALYHAASTGRHEIVAGGRCFRLGVSKGRDITFAHMDFKIDREKSLFAVGIEIANNTHAKIFEIPVALKINGKTEQIKKISLEADEIRRIEYFYRYLQSGVYKIRVSAFGEDESDEKTACIRDFVCVTPKVKDLSPCRNDAFLRGSPKVVKQGDGTVLYFQNDGDYLEIPDSDSLNVADEFTGMVWANIDRLAYDNEMAHNPLMVKGKSVGWGATYLIRMVVDRTGAMKWGTCHNSTEYAWEGGSAALHQWVQYTMTFSKKTGGNSYCNAEKVAHVPGISEESDLRNFRHEPLFIGYSYIGHVIPQIDRPKYYTHLPAQVSQVRFYRKELSQNENELVFRNPCERGPKQDGMVVWLDFNHIEDTGTHTTEWRRPAAFTPTYKRERKYWSYRRLGVGAEVPSGTSLNVTVEVSDDRKFVKETIKTEIGDGSSEIDLSALPPSQYLRIRTEFKADIGADGVKIPQLEEYRATAFRGGEESTLVWATRYDWEKGKFEGAIGFQPVDRLKTFDEYTDVIHG